jgi:hypothetical protein
MKQEVYNAAMVMRHSPNRNKIHLNITADETTA